MQLQFIHIAQVLQPLSCWIRPTKHEDASVVDGEGRSESELERTLVIAFAAVPCFVVNGIDVNGMYVLG